MRLLSQKWLISILLPLALLGSFSAEARSARETKIALDCCRALAGCFARNFKPFETAGESKPTTPKSVSTRSLEEIYPAVFTAWNDALRFATPHEYLDLTSIDRLKAFAYLAKTPAEKEIVLSVIKLRMSTVSLRSELTDIKKIVEQDLTRPPVTQRPLPIDPGAQTSTVWIFTRKIEKTVTLLFGKNTEAARLVRELKNMIMGKPVLNPDYLGDRATMKANEGIKQYWSKEIQLSDTLYGDALVFYSQLKKRDGSARRSTVPVESEIGRENTSQNIWKLALESSENDQIRALRVLSIFGHDNVEQELVKGFGTHDERIDLLNSFVPNFDSYLYENGAIPPLQISAALIQQFNDLREERDLLIQEYPSSWDRLFISPFRAGNYHFIGGAMVANELLLKGFTKIAGFDVAPLLSEILGYVYKRVTMESVYLDEHARTLYQAGYPRKNFDHFENWSNEDLDIAKFEVKLHLLHLKLTHEQHQVGANWAKGLRNAK